MLNRENIYVILFSIPIYQLLFYTVQLVTFRKTSPSKRYLGFLMLGMTVFLLMNAIYHLGYHEIFSWIYYFFIPVLLGIAPAFFLYFLSLAREDHDVTLKERLALYSPPIAFLLLNAVVYGLLPEDSRIAFIRQGLASGSSGNHGMKMAEMTFWLGSSGLVILQVILLIARIRSIMRMKAALMKQKPDYLAYLNWKWVLIITAGVMGFLVINGVVHLLDPVRYVGTAAGYNVLMLLCGGIAGYYGMKQNSLLLQVSKMTRPSDLNVSEEYLENEENRLPAGTAEFISPEETERITSMLIRLMEEQKPYLNADFSMGDLCILLKESRRKVTYVINDHLEKNFYGIVNDYRIREAVEILSQDRHNNYKIEVIAEMAGFQSKSSFNACFKKFTGQTPSAFKASVSARKVQGSRG